MFRLYETRWYGLVLLILRTNAQRPTYAKVVLGGSRHFLHGAYAIQRNMITIILLSKMFHSISAVLIDVRLEAGICHRCATALPASVTNMSSCVRKYAHAHACVSVCVSQIGICVLGSCGTLLRRRVRQVMHRDNQNGRRRWIDNKHVACGLIASVRCLSY